ncbi:hypothetical protein FQN50_007815 [Emmonsiellopsis sp. PD_5]|nr:hypothetical protein FQN50_007815 [Emmonsiellopsis sp. PD_5]
MSSRPFNPLPATPIPFQWDVEGRIAELQAMINDSSTSEPQKINLQTAIKLYREKELPGEIRWIQDGKVVRHKDIDFRRPYWNESIFVTGWLTSNPFSLRTSNSHIARSMIVSTLGHEGKSVPTIVVLVEPELNHNGWPWNTHKVRALTRQHGAGDISLPLRNLRLYNSHRPSRSLYLSETHVFKLSPALSLKNPRIYNLAVVEAAEFVSFPTIRILWASALI